MARRVLLFEFLVLALTAIFGLFPQDGETAAEIARRHGHEGTAQLIEVSGFVRNGSSKTPFL